MTFKISISVATILSVAAIASGCGRKDAMPAVNATAAGDAAAAATPSLPPPLETRERNGVDYNPAFAGQTRVPGVDSKTVLDVKPVAQGLNLPWSFEILPDGRFLVAERPGALRIVSSDGKISAPVAGVPAVHFKGQGGLLDVALAPDFATSGTIYFSFAEPRKGGNGTALATAKLVEAGSSAKLEGLKVIFHQMPTFDSDLHFGSRIAFSADGKLFMTMGERALPPAMVQSQDLNSHFGKVIRLNLDGSVPADNPFVGRADAKPEIWSYGHRNMQAATVDSATGRLWTIEHGPRGGDELNHPEPGKNYGWPVISYGINYPGDKIGAGITQQTGMEQPVYYWDPVIAPSGVMVYHGAMFPQWQGSLFVGGLGSNKLVRLVMDGEKVVGEEWLLQDLAKRIRDVQQASDGAIYVITEDGDKSSLLRVQSGAAAPAAG
jgi:aldose sugar dehydrogenase